MYITIEKLRKKARVPESMSIGDSGFDVYSPSTVLIRPGEKLLLARGFRMKLPKHPMADRGYRYEAQIRPRSGVSTKTPLEVILGTIDNYFTGEVAVTVRNAGRPMYHVKTKIVNDIFNFESCIKSTVQAEEDYGVLSLNNQVVSLKDVPNPVPTHLRYAVPKGTYVIQEGERIAQIVFNEVIKFKMREGLVEESESRGSGGFGSTGI